MKISSLGEELDLAEVEEVEQHTGLSQEFDREMNMDDAEWLPNDGKCPWKLLQNYILQNIMQKTCYDLEHTVY